MGTLRYAVLGLLNRKDMTGYELTRKFNSSLAEFWSARHSQIYPELRSLANEGLVTYEVETSGTSLEKKRYSITDEGRQAFMAWERTPRAPKPTPKDEFRLQLFFSDSLKPAERAALLNEEMRVHTLRLEHLEKNEAELLAGRDGATLKGAEQSDYLVLLGALERERAACRWLEKCLELCDEKVADA